MKFSEYVASLVQLPNSSLVNLSIHQKRNFTLMRVAYVYVCILCRLVMSVSG